MVTTGMALIFIVIAISALIGAAIFLERDVPFSTLLGIVATILLVLAGMSLGKGSPNPSNLPSGEVRELLCSAPYNGGENIGALLRAPDGDLEFLLMAKNPPAKIFASKGNGEYVPYLEGK